MSGTALRVIDAQVGMFKGKPIYQAEETLGRIARLIDWARASSTPVIYVQDDDIGGPETPDWEVHPKLSLLPGDLRVRKLAADAFFDTGLQEELETRNINHLVITGFKTQFCVDVTSRRAAYLGYHVTLVGDGHNTSDLPFLSAEKLVEYHNALLDGMNGPGHGFSTLAGIEVKPSSEIRF